MEDLGSLKGGFRFRRITVIARIVSSWQVSSWQVSSWHGLFHHGRFHHGTDCFIMAGFIMARIVSSWQVNMSMQRLRSWRPSMQSATFEIASAGFSGPIQRALVWQSSKLPHLFHRPCGADSFLLLMACQTSQ